MRFFWSSPIFSFTLLLLGLVNALWWQQPLLGLLAFIAFIFSSGLAFSRARLADFPPFAGPAAILAFMMIGGSLLYYIAPVTLIPLVGLVLAIIATFTIGRKNADPVTLPAISSKSRLLFIIAFVACLIFSVTVFGHQITSAVRSPWDIIPSSLLVFIALAAGAYWTKSLSKNQSLALPIILFSSLSVFALAYPLGYGFDPYIHRATIQHILDFGTITPKPLYYIGQYALELIATKVFGAGLLLVDRFLCVILAAIILPLAGEFFLPRQKAGHSLWLIFPIAAFTYTTPQSIAYLFFILVIATSFYAMRANTKPAYALMWLFAAATLATHPLAGLPAILVAATFSAQTIKYKFPRALLTFTGLAITAAGIPLLFLVQKYFQGLPITIAWHAPQIIPTLDFTNHYSSWIDLLYAFIRNSWLIFVIFAAAGLISQIKQKAPAAKIATLYLALSGGLLLSYIILSSAFDFTFLVDSEKANYADRLPYLALCAALPLIFLGYQRIIIFIQNRPLTLPASAIIFSLLATSNVYASYPRNDGEVKSAGFNISAADVEVVRSVHEHFTTYDYAVLANQTVAAAALQEYGFAEYFKGDIFYYPIPTGGDLYQIYLNMANKTPTKEMAKKAAAVTGAKHIVFISNDYWTDSARIREIAKTEANAWWAIGGKQETVIFVYDF